MILISFSCFQASSFYKQDKTPRWVAAESPQDSDFEIEDGDYDIVRDPDFVAAISDGDSDLENVSVQGPPTKKKKGKLL